MRSGSKNNIRNYKSLARTKYAERKIDKYINWSIKTKGYIKYSFNYFTLKQPIVLNASAFINGVPLNFNNFN